MSGSDVVSELLDVFALSAVIVPIQIGLRQGQNQDSSPSKTPNSNNHGYQSRALGPRFIVHLGAFTYQEPMLA